MKKPIENYEVDNPLIKELLRSIGKGLGEAMPPGYGFALQIFKFDGEEFFHISNAERNSLIPALKEWIAKEEKKED